MRMTSEMVIAAMADLKNVEKREGALRRRLRRRDCRLIVRGNGLVGWSYHAVNRTTGSSEFGPAPIDEIEAWAKGGVA